MYQKQLRLSLLIRCPREVWERAGDRTPNQYGQHSLTSVERPSYNYLRSDFVNVWRQARLVVYIYLWLMYAFASIVHSDLSDDLTVCFEVLSCFFDHRSIDSTKKMILHPFGNNVLMFCLDQASNSASRRSLQWMLLSNIPWMAPDGMAFRKNYTNKQIKLKWTAAPSNNFFKILAGIIENYPYGNVCLCRIIMNTYN